MDILLKKTMRCGGCGSKVGAQVLGNVMKTLAGRVPTNAAVVAGIGDDAALMRLPPNPNALLVHTVDYFRSFVSDPYLFGQIAANHSLSDIHAMNGTAQSALAISVVPYGMERTVESELVQMLAGACVVLSADGCALVGGHTAEGAELSLGNRPRRGGSSLSQCDA